MSVNDKRSQFDIELKKRFEEFVTWAVTNRPDHSSPLSRADFDPARKAIEALAYDGLDLGERNAAIPEPSENGPQYVNVNPTPWP